MNQSNDQGWGQAPTSQPSASSPSAMPGHPVPGQQPYGQQPGAGQAGPNTAGLYPVSVAQYPVVMLPQHPQATMILVLGIAGYFTFVTAIIAWVLGHKAEKEMAASGQRFANESYIKIGKLLGIVFTIVGALGVVLVIVYAAFVFSIMGSMLQGFR